MYFARRLALLVVLALLAGCGTTSVDALRSAHSENLPPIDFSRIEGYVLRASAVYDFEETLRERVGGGVVAVVDLPLSQVRYFLEVDPKTGVQTVSVRGTSNLENIRVDAEFLPEAATEIGVPLHRGFAVAAEETYEDLRPRLDPAKPVRLTGHSLGGAIAVVLGMHLARDGFTIDQIVTFGQPKVTSIGGAQAYSKLPILRFRMEGDPVADVPPAVPHIDSVWHYSHLGREVILHGEREYTQLAPEDAILQGAISFYRNLGSHKVEEHAIVIYEEAIEKRAKPAPATTP